jgi:hypothetical protein
LLVKITYSQLVSAPASSSIYSPSPLSISIFLQAIYVAEVFHGAIRRLIHKAELVFAARGADGQVLVNEIRPDILRSWFIVLGPAMFKRPIRLGQVNSAEIVDARIPLRFESGLIEIGNDNGHQQSQDCRDHSDLDKRKTSCGMPVLSKSLLGNPPDEGTGPARHTAFHVIL